MHALRGDLCHKQTGIVTVIHYCTDDHQLLIYLIRQICTENRNFRLPHLHNDASIRVVPFGILP